MEGARALLFLVFLVIFGYVIFCDPMLTSPNQKISQKQTLSHKPQPTPTPFPECYKNELKGVVICANPLKSYIENTGDAPVRIIKMELNLGIEGKERTVWVKTLSAHERISDQIEPGEKFLIFQNGQFLGTIPIGAPFPNSSSENPFRKRR